MAAPIYQQAQVVAMLSTPKFVKHDEWQQRYEGRKATPTGFNTRIEVFPEDPSDETKFSIEAIQSFIRPEVSFTLIAKLKSYPPEALCRYDWHSGRHLNPPWYPGWS